ncbi:glycoside hydrolase family 3 N-terminal domain-containing protein, partial [Zunongwangia profunda]
MKLNSLFLGVFLCLGNLVQAQLNSTVHDKEIESLIDKMTIEEKVGQMTQITLDVITKGEDIYSSYEPFELDQDSLNKALVDYHIGSVLNTANNRALTPQKWYSLISQIQETALKDRLEIPVLYGVDMIHGATYTVG